MKKEKILTVTVPCYNSAPFMHECVDSLLTGGDDVEILIIDDGSTDETGAIADAYAARYPDLVRVIHQENGGHGEGINQGIRNARGTYFKVVDSDDWVDTASLRRVLDRLKSLEREGGVDLLVCNYVYTYRDGRSNQVINYSNVFPADKVIGWDEIGSFRVNQYITIHSATFRTEVLHACGIVLPKHTFYEDNLYVYAPLPLVKRLCYLNENLYHYFIGRDGQSVSEEGLKKHYAHQVEVSKRIFFAADVPAVKKQNKKLGKYMHHEISMMLSIAGAVARLTNTPESEKCLMDAWKEIEASSAYGRRLRWSSLGGMAAIPTAAGRAVCRAGYWIAHHVVAFN